MNPRIPSPPITDPVLLARGKDILIRYYRRITKELLAELADREALITELAQELAGLR